MITLPDGDWTPEQAAAAMLDVATDAALERAEKVYLAIEGAMARGEGPPPVLFRWAFELAEGACLQTVAEVDYTGTLLGVPDDLRRQCIVDRANDFIDRLDALMTMPTHRGNA